jgi:hypothetical protein
VKEYLLDHPQANPKEVNRAWKESGMEGTISDTLVNKQRAAMKLTGNIRRGRGAKRAAVKRRGRRPGQGRSAARATTASPKRGRPAGRTVRMNEIEADLDRILYKVMDVGELHDVEDALRLARRRLFSSLAGNGR